MVSARARLRHVFGDFGRRCRGCRCRARPSTEWNYACALVAAGACTGIPILPSIAYIVIGLVLGFLPPRCSRLR